MLLILNCMPFYKVGYVYFLNDLWVKISKGDNKIRQNCFIVIFFFTRVQKRSENWTVVEVSAFAPLEEGINSTLNSNRYTPFNKVSILGIGIRIPFFPNFIPHSVRRMRFEWVVAGSFQRNWTDAQSRKNSRTKL